MRIYLYLCCSIWPDRVTQPLNSGNVIASRPFKDNTRGGGFEIYLSWKSNFPVLGSHGSIRKALKTNLLFLGNCFHSSNDYGDYDGDDDDDNADDIEIHQNHNDKSDDDKKTRGCCKAYYPV